MTPDRIRGAAYELVSRASADPRVRDAAARRASELGIELPGAPVPEVPTVSRRLFDARLMVESSAFDFERASAALAELGALPGCEGEAHVLLAAAHVREGRRLRTSGEAQAAAEHAVSALRELTSALGADPANRRGLALLDEIDSLTGYARLTDELRRATDG